MFLSHLDPSSRAFVMMLLLDAPDLASSLVSFLPPEDQPVVLDAVKTWQSSDKKLKKQFIHDELSRQQMQSHWGVLSQVHPDWIVDALSQESPRMIATVLRYLPAETVRVVLDKLSAETLKNMPTLAQTFSLDVHLINALKEILENRFAQLKQNNDMGLSFATIPMFSAKKLGSIFRELGFRELAMALKGFDEESKSLILKRLSPRDGALLKLHFEQITDVPEERLKQAQNHVLSLDLKKGALPLLVLEAGFFVYSKALLQEHIPSMQVLQLKFSMEESRLLKKYVEMNVPVNISSVAGKYQKEVMQIVQKLAG
ncbi:MAG TPA: hypothetical protein DDW49_11310 [Deltaproteobacteria bacterium]|nr:MAG: hypothetical protein A2048_01715 [Deltaproteobacteria bacterium GWA2_45_12]HBF13954.1 hypothetical protein [Deltaproteobacteria bacterium]